MIDNDPSNPAPTSQPAGDLAVAATQIATAVCHYVNTQNEIHKREQIAVMRRLDMEASSIQSVSITSRAMQIISVVILGSVLWFAIDTKDTPLIHQILSVFGGVAIGGWFKK